MMKAILDAAFNAMSRDLALAFNDPETLTRQVEGMMIDAVWTLRKMPDREAGLLYSRQIQWPDMNAGRHTAGPPARSVREARKRIPASPRSISRMQLVLDLLRLLPDVVGRRIFFWSA